MQRSRAVSPLILSALLVVACGGEQAALESSVSEAPLDDETFLLERAAELELPGEWVAPPGDALDHHTAGFAKTLCSGVFLTGLEPADAAENVGYFTAPYEHRAQVVDTVVDFDAQSVSLTLPSGVVRTAKRYGSQGCVTLPIGEDSVYFTPTVVEPNLPEASTTPWPMGDVLPETPTPPGIDAAKIAQAVAAAFPDGGMTLGFVVTHQGQIIGERYGEGVDIHTPLESWSMGKSLTGAIMGTLIQKGAYELWQPAPIPEWQEAGDGRQEIRIGDIMRMSSGIRIRAPQDPDYDPELGYPDHLYLYTGTVDSYQWAATRPQQWSPNTVGRYRNTDPVLTNYLNRLGIENLGEDYHTYPQRHLFDKIGIRNMVMETDPYGNFLTQGYEFGSARDWARLANLYLQDGVWNGERILPEGYVEYANTLAPAWLADRRPQYGGAFMWINGRGSFPVPEDAMYMAGAGGQFAIMIPSHGLAVVRLGKYKGADAGGEGLREALSLIMEAVPPLAG